MARSCRAANPCFCAGTAGREWDEVMGMPKSMTDRRDTLSRWRQYVLRCNHRRDIHYKNYSTNFPRAADIPQISI